MNELHQSDRKRKKRRQAFSEMLHPFDSLDNGSANCERNTLNSRNPFARQNSILPDTDSSLKRLGTVAGGLRSQESAQGCDAISSWLASIIAINESHSSGPSYFASGLSDGLAPSASFGSVFRTMSSSPQANKSAAFSECKPSMNQAQSFLPPQVHGVKRRRSDMSDRCNASEDVWKSQLWF